MTSFLDKSQVTIGASPMHKHPFHSMHLTTGNFMQFDVAFAKEFPKHSIKFNHQSFVRVMPMKKPIMGSVQFHKSAYFVPFRTVWEPFTDFKEDSPHVQSDGAAILTNVPLLDNNKLIKFLINNGAQYLSSSTNADFTVYSESVGQNVYYQYNTFGRHCIKLLRQLGYKPLFAEYDETETATVTFSALPLLCLAKVYIDYFYPVQYAKTGYYINLEGIFDRQDAYVLSVNDLLSIFRVCYVVSYSSDYFVSAFDNPVAGSDNTFSNDFSIVDLSLVNQGDTSLSGTATVTQDGNGTPVVAKTPITQYSIDALQALTNYIRRHQLSSSRSLERYLADWGVALTADKLQRCYKLGEKHFPLQVADIVSSSDTYNEETGDGAQLGDYAGKGVAFNQDFNFESESDEFGYLIVINTIVPDIAYYQGVDRNVFHKTKLDYLEGEFDGKLITPIMQCELFAGDFRPGVYDQIFGFLPAYAEYATIKDIVSGDFAVNHLNTGLLGWSTVREFSDEIGDDTFDVVHNLNFVLANDFDQYNRIFMNEEDDSDKFIIVHRANFEAYIPKVPLYDYYDFDDGKKKINMQVNGVKSN